jgi:cell division protein FtsL
MARSSAATVAPPAKRRKPSQGGPRHASTQTHRRPARRTSGPAKGTHARKRPVAAAEARAASVAAPPVRRTAPRPRTAPRKRAQAAPLIRRLIHGRTGALIDGLLRGRACVGIVFVLLVGVVFANVSLLEMNKGIAATNARATAIEQENSKLRRQIAPLSSSERIQTEAVKRGFSLPAAGDVGFVGGDVDKNAKKAVARMTAPGMGEGTASRPAAQVEQQEDAEQAAAQAATTPAPAAPAPTPAPAPAPTAPVSATTQQSAPPTATQP